MERVGEKVGWWVAAVAVEVRLAPWEKDAEREGVRGGEGYGLLCITNFLGCRMKSLFNTGCVVFVDVLKYGCCHSVSVSVVVIVIVAVSTDKPSTVTEMEL